MLLALADTTSIAQAQTSPSLIPDALQRNPAANPDRINAEQRRRLEERAQGDTTTPSRPEVEAPPPASAAGGAADSVTFRLTAVRFSPSDYLSRAQLEATAADLIGRDVGVGDLRTVVDRVNALYAARGLTTARAVLPPQDVRSGVVDVRLVEGRIGETRVEKATGRSADYVRRRGGLAPGALASPADLTRRLRQFNQNNDVQLRARLAPGAQFGMTDLVLVAVEPRRLSADIFTDNQGFESTGRQEVGAVLRGYRLFDAADRLTAVAVASRGVRSANASYSVPMGDRFRLGASASYGTTRILFGNLARLGVRGTSSSFGADASALLLVSDRATLTATAAVQTTMSTTRIAGATVIRNELLTPTVGLTAAYAVPGLALTIAHQLAVPTVRERISGDGVSPLMWQGSIAATSGSVDGWQVRARAEWQLASASRLPGILQFQIGGPRSSRAFEPGIGAGDRGLAAGLEIGRTFTAPGVQIDPFVFVDHAQASQPGLFASLQSLGAGVAVAVAPRVQARATVAHSIGDRNAGGPSSRAFAAVTLRF